jgi:two-component system chemotaxis sensor kinase CheA
MQEQVVESRLVPIWQIFDRLPRLVRDAARTLRKDVNLEVTGKDLEVDRSLLEAINEPLVHLLRNAVDHGIESPEERERLGKPRAGRIELSARRERSRVIIEVSDDGHGVDREAVIARARSEGLLAGDADPDDQELFRILARPGFSTARVVSAYSGRGVGLDVVEDVVHGLGGSVQLKTRAGEGARFRLELPLSLAILHALIVEVGRETYAIPAAFARESFELEGKDVQHAHGREWVRWREERLPLTRLQRLFAGGSAGAGGANGDGDGALSLVALEFGGRRLAVSVDAFVGEEEIVVRPVTLPRGTVPVFSGCTLRPDGRPALVIDVGSLARRP